MAHNNIFCDNCELHFHKKPSEISKHNYCSKECDRQYKNKLYEPERKWNKFYKSSWSNMNIRAGKYRHLQTKNKCKVYKTVLIEFSREEYKNWCYNIKEHISSLKKPSLDRIDRTKNYSLDNIQVIELEDNIRKKRFGCSYFNGPKHGTLRGIKKYGKRWEARISIKAKTISIGIYNTKEEAYNAFYNKFKEIHGFAPWIK